MAGEILTCVQFDAVANTCTVEAWMPAPTLLPVLSISDANLIGAGIVALWCYAYGWNRIEKFVRGAR